MYIVEPAVISNERLWQDGPEPIVWIVVDHETSEIDSIHLTEQAATSRMVAVRRFETTF